MTLYSQDAQQSSYKWLFFLCNQFLRESSQSVWKLINAKHECLLLRTKTPNSCDDGV